MRLLYSRFRRFSSAFFAEIHERNDYPPSSSRNLFTLSDNLPTLQLSFCKYQYLSKKHILRPPNSLSHGYAVPDLRRSACLPPAQRAASSTSSKRELFFIQSSSKKRMLHKARPYGHSGVMCSYFFPQHCRGAHRAPVIGICAKFRICSFTVE